MTKIILPLLATMVVVAGAAAQTPRTAPAAGNPGASQGAVEMAARQKQKCQDDYAHAVGDLAYMEVRLSLTQAQQPLFDRWKNVKLDAARRDTAACTTRELPRLRGKLPTPLDDMAREQENLKRRLADLSAEIPLFTSFYNALNPAQKDALANPAQQAMQDRRRVFSAAMAQRLGPGNGPGGPPLPPQ